ncbi:hypothetical protein B0T18DRAFT_291361, partial [Schizothecium vesticola]
SGLRPPSQYQSTMTAPAPAPAMGLQEITDSQSNARAQMPPPPHGVKRMLHGNPSLPEPKRKTLVERAGEPIGGTKSSCIPTTASGLARPTGTVKGSSIASLATTNPKPTSAIAAVSRFPNLPRPPSVTNFSQTLGPGSRPPVYNPRPGTSMNFTPSVNNRPRANTRPRPATAMGSHELEEEEQGQQP